MPCAMLDETNAFMKYQIDTSDDMRPRQLWHATSARALAAERICEPASRKGGGDAPQVRAVGDDDLNEDLQRRVADLHVEMVAVEAEQEEGGTRKGEGESESVNGSRAARSRRADAHNR